MISSSVIDVVHTFTQTHTHACTRTSAHIHLHAHTQILFDVLYGRHPSSPSVSHYIIHMHIYIYIYIIYIYIYLHIYIYMYIHTATPHSHQWANPLMSHICNCFWRLYIYTECSKSQSLTRLVLISQPLFLSQPLPLPLLLLLLLPLLHQALHHRPLILRRGLLHTKRHG